jgi:hypothetical protein
MFWENILFVVLIKINRYRFPNPDSDLYYKSETTSRRKFFMGTEAIVQVINVCFA